MCGIVGYIGNGGATEFLIEGLRRLEYRGYDSAGIGTITADGTFAITKTPGRIETLAQALGPTPADGSIGIGHTRWATHGPATQENAHPHLDYTQEIAVVHNGVIENYVQRVRVRPNILSSVLYEFLNLKIVAYKLLSYCSQSDPIAAIHCYDTLQSVHSWSLIAFNDSKSNTTR